MATTGSENDSAAAFSTAGPLVQFDDVLSHQTAVSAAFASVFRGKLCDLVRPIRKPTSYRKNQVIYDVGDSQRTFFFIQSGYVKVGTLSSEGTEVIYDVRKEGDVVGELCATELVRPDRAVALEPTDAVAVSFDEVMRLVSPRPDLVGALIEYFGRALKEAYAQVNSLALDDTIHRLARTLVGLAAKVGRATGPMVELPMYLTQDEIAQMVAARRERVSGALNAFRRKGMVLYTARGQLLLDVGALESYLRR